MGLCNEVAVGVLLTYRGSVAVATRGHSGDLAPSAGHVEKSDGLGRVDMSQNTWAVAQYAAARELGEETGYAVSPLALRPVFARWLNGPCGRTLFDGSRPSKHLWFLFACETPRAPALRDEPGKMHDWRFVPYGELVVSPRLESSWRVLLSSVETAVIREGVR